jgi:uncharacterized Fe-S radical SAM superfamily protein PflX
MIRVKNNKVLTNSLLFSRLKMKELHTDIIVRYMHLPLLLEKKDLEDFIKGWVHHLLVSVMLPYNSHYMKN